MKTTFVSCVLLLCSCLPVALRAQETNSPDQKKHTELGFTTGSLTDLGQFSVELKRGHDNRYVRYSLLSLRSEETFGNGFTSDHSGWDNQLGFGIGLERRKELLPKLKFLHGPNLTLAGNYQYNNSSLQTGHSVVASASFGWRLGLMYHFAQRIYCSAEIMPGASYFYNYSQHTQMFGSTELKNTSITQGTSLSISTSGLRLGLFFQF